MWLRPQIIPDAEVRFDILDRRPKETTVFHTGYGIESFYCGGTQFFSERMRAVTTRFAQAFPDASPGTVLIVERFDVGHCVVRDEDWGRNAGCSILADCFFLLAWKALDNMDADRNLVLSRLSGTFNGIAVDVTEQYQYLHYDMQAHPIHVVNLLDRTITAVVRDVRHRMVPAQHRRPDVADQPPSPLPRIGLPRDDLPQQGRRGRPVFRTDSAIESDAVRSTSMMPCSALANALLHRAYQRRTMSEPT